MTMCIFLQIMVCQNGTKFEFSSSVEETETASSTNEQFAVARIQEYLYC